MDTQAIIFAIVSIGGLGIIFGAILGFASKIFAVDEDPRNVFQEQTAVDAVIPDAEVLQQLSLQVRLLLTHAHPVALKRQQLLLRLWVWLQKKQSLWLRL